MSLKSFLFGSSKPKAIQTPTLTPDQTNLVNTTARNLQPVQKSGLEFLQSLISQDPEAISQFEKPALRQFREETIPGLAEQYNAMGALTGGNFQQALLHQARTLSENLAQMRGNLGLQATGLAQGYNSPALQSTFQTNFLAPRQGFLQGLLQQIAPVLGAIATGGASGIASGAAGGLGSLLGGPGGGGGGSKRFGLF